MTPSGMLTLLGLAVVALLPRSASHSIWEGSWIIREGKTGYDRTIDCSGSVLDKVAREFQVTLECPNLATDEFGNKGTWVTIFDYGVEIIIQGRKYYSFPWKRQLKDDFKASWLGIPQGWSHDLLGNNWACFQGVRRGFGETEKNKSNDFSLKPIKTFEGGSELFRTDHALIEQINNGQSFWKATRHPKFEQMTMDQIRNLAGGKNSFLSFKSSSSADDSHKPKRQPIKRNSTVPYTPTSFDWRDVDGKNYVAPVRDQGHCGSCYAFAATAMQEARIRILTRNAIQPVYSPQDLVDCSPYAFGCGGGILFSEAKYGEDYGYAEESCSPYKGYENKCVSVKSCQRTYSTDYEFIGTDVGGCNEEDMRVAVYYKGPIVVGFTVFVDIIHYKSGIYYHYGPDYALGGHAVTIVGYGEDEQTGTKYWIVKNSWGSDWGDNGYFRIIRGINECGFEDVAWQADPIL